MKQEEEELKAKLENQYEKIQYLVGNIFKKRDEIETQLETTQTILSTSFSESEAYKWWLSQK